jgi:bidirectional [NiFe] hydrogenase diaphorase subunit
VDRDAHPSGDKRFALLDAAMKRHQYRGDALLEVLHTAQELFGFLSLDLLVYVAHALKLPPSRVYGVATFYHFFSLAPRGRHSCVVCLGTACFVKGAAGVLAALERACGVRAGQTSSDGLVSVLTARCVGACSLAPTALFDNEIVGRVSPEAALARVGEWRGDGAH